MSLIDQILAGEDPRSVVSKALRNPETEVQRVLNLALSYDRDGFEEAVQELADVGDITTLTGIARAYRHLHDKPEWGEPILKSVGAMQRISAVERKRFSEQREARITVPTGDADDVVDALNQSGIEARVVERSVTEFNPFNLPGGGEEEVAKIAVRADPAVIMSAKEVADRVVGGLVGGKQRGIHTEQEDAHGNILNPGDRVMFQGFEWTVELTAAGNLILARDGQRAGPVNPKEVELVDERRRHTESLDDPQVGEVFKVGGVDQVVISRTGDTFVTTRPDGGIETSWDLDDWREVVSLGEITDERRHL